jgi:hypothetical protein
VKLAFFEFQFGVGGEHAGGCPRGARADGVALEYGRICAAAGQLPTDGEPDGTAADDEYGRIHFVPMRLM